MLKLPGTGAKHRSESLSNFVLEYPSTDSPPLTCTINCEFNYDDQEEDGVIAVMIHIVYPDPEKNFAIGCVKEAGFLYLTALKQSNLFSV